jgi:phage RecT family recombinase
MYKNEVIKRFSDMLGEKQAQRFVASVLTAVMADPKLQSCTPSSIYLAAVRSATLGLSVDPAYGQAYLVAYKDVCTFMPGYKGFRDKASENGIGCNVTEVYSNEIVEQNMETGEIRINGGSGKWRTISQNTGSNGFAISGYLASWWEVKNQNGGEKHFLYMTIAMIEEYANEYAPAYKYKDSPWNKSKLSRAEMFKKTVLKRLLRKTAPMNPVVSRLLMDFNEEKAQEQNDDFDGIEIKGAKEQSPRKSREQNMRELSFGVESTNPDPVKDEHWNNWLALCEKADALNVSHPNPEKESITNDNLEMGFCELLERVNDAEFQAQSGKDIQ